MMILLLFIFHCCLCQGNSSDEEDIYSDQKGMFLLTLFQGPVHQPGEPFGGGMKCNKFKPDVSKCMGVNTLNEGIPWRGDFGDKSEKKRKDGSSLEYYGRETQCWRLEGFYLQTIERNGTTGEIVNEYPEIENVYLRVDTHNFVEAEDPHRYGTFFDRDHTLKLFTDSECQRQVFSKRIYMGVCTQVSSDEVFSQCNSFLATNDSMFLQGKFGDVTTVSLFVRLYEFCNLGFWKNIAWMLSLKTQDDSGISISPEISANSILFVIMAALWFANSVLIYLGFIIVYFIKNLQLPKRNKDRDRAPHPMPEEGFFKSLRKSLFFKETDEELARKKVPSVKHLFHLAMGYIKFAVSVVSILIADGFSMWVGSSILLENSNSLSSYVETSIFNEMLKILTYIILFTYFAIHFLEIFVWTFKYMHNPFKFAIVYSCLKEYLFYRYFKVAVKGFFFFFFIIMFLNNLYNWTTSEIMMKGNIDPRFNSRIPNSYAPTSYDLVQAMAYRIFKFIMAETLLFLSIKGVLTHNGPSSYVFVEKLNKNFHVPRVDVGFLFDNHEGFVGGLFRKLTLVRTPEDVKMMKTHPHFADLGWSNLEKLNLRQLRDLRSFFFDVKDFRMCPRTQFYDMFFFISPISKQFWKLVLNKFVPSEKPVHHRYNFSLISDHELTKIMGGEEDDEDKKKKIQIEEEESITQVVVDPDLHYHGHWKHEDCEIVLGLKGLRIKTGVTEVRYDKIEEFDISETSHKGFFNFYLHYYKKEEDNSTSVEKTIIGVSGADKDRFSKAILSRIPRDTQEEDEGRSDSASSGGEDEDNESDPENEVAGEDGDESESE